MNKIPTAEEFCKNYTRLRSAMAIQDLTECMNEYTKLHVKAALEAAANTNVPPEYYGEENSKTRTSMDKHVILNAYPESNIK